MNKKYTTRFFRKPTPEEIYPRDSYNIKKVILITEDEFEVFINNPLKDYDFIANNKTLMGMDEDGVRNCILVCAKSYPNAVLIDSEGYDYARYTANLYIADIQELTEEGC